MKKPPIKSHADIIYPEKAYVAYILIIRNNNFRVFLPFNEIFTEINLIKPYTKIFIENSRDENTFIPPAPIVFPINLAEKIPLKPQYWNEPTDELTRTERINNFLKPLENYHFQKLLVTPLKSANKTILTAAYCFNIHAKETEISFFMSNFFLSMDEKTKSAAIYHFENPFCFDFDTEQKVEIKDKFTNVSIH